MITLNVGTWDRWMRLIIGAGVVSLAFWGPKTAWAFLGPIPVATGLLRYCPAYRICGISTTMERG